VDSDKDVRGSADLQVRHRAVRRISRERDEGRWGHRHARSLDFTDSALAGLSIDAGKTAKIVASTFEHNTNQGIYISGRADISDRSLIIYNGGKGIQFDNPGMLGTTIRDSDVAHNGGTGIDISKLCSSPLNTFPHGNNNNIFANGTGGPGTPLQLGTINQCKALPVDWDNNYWGSDVYFWFVPKSCGGAASRRSDTWRTPGAQGHGRRRRVDRFARATRTIP
jgi:hypothetical protein